MEEKGASLGRTRQSIHFTSQQQHALMLSAVAGDLAEAVEGMQAPSSPRQIETFMSIDDRLIRYVTSADTQARRLPRQRRDGRLPLAPVVLDVQKAILSHLRSWTRDSQGCTHESPVW